MKRVYFLLVLTGIFCVSTVASAQTVLKVNVPFEFVVRGNTLPAASYSIQKPLSSDSTGIAFLADSEYLQTRATAIDVTQLGTRLQFLKIADKYFLTDVVTPTGTLHFRVLDRDKQLVMNGGGQTSTASIAAQIK